MLVLFTESARVQAGGASGQCADTAGIMAHIHQGISDIDTAFKRSEIDAHMGVVSIAKLEGYPFIAAVGTSYDQSLANRNALRNSTAIETLRDAVGADVVQIIFDTQDNLGPCGVAYVQRRTCSGQSDSTLPAYCIGAPFKEHAYYLNTVQCDLAGDVFVHELGHVLGAEHDAAHSTTPPSWASHDYAFGYLVPGEFQTVMAQEFDVAAPPPPRRLQFSNPNVSVWVTPTGDASKADNARAINNLVAGVAAFRSRPDDPIFADGFDLSACPALNY